MGYTMYELCARVRIDCGSFSDALAAIKSLHGSETCGHRDDMHFMWINDSASFLNAKTLDEALYEWRWPVLETDNNGSVVELEFRGESYGDEDMLFGVIAPFVMEDSEIRMIGEDGTLWRWRFTGKQVRKEYGRVVFDRQALELARMEDQIGNWPHDE